jgi:hypothetical protein
MGSDGKTLRVIPSLDYFSIDEIRSKKLGIHIIIIIIIIIIIMDGLMGCIGLAMTRSLGHTILSTCGVSAEPDFFTATLQYPPFSCLFFLFFHLIFNNCFWQLLKGRGQADHRLRRSVGRAHQHGGDEAGVPLCRPGPAGI